MDDSRLKMLLPAGRLRAKVLEALSRCGMEFAAAERCYRPPCSDPRIDAKIVKPRNIPGLVALGRHHCGFTGHDWVVEEDADVEELLDLGYDQAELVSAVPEEPVRHPNGRIVVGTEYPFVTAGYLARKGIEGLVVRSWGATEALPPDDADMVVDIASTGATLLSNRLRVVDRIMPTSTRLVASRPVLDGGGAVRAVLEDLVMLLRSVLDADSRRILEMNVPAAGLEAVVRMLPCMRAPTVSELWGGAGYSVKVALPAAEVPQLIPRLSAMGVDDILEYGVEKIVTREASS